MKTTYALAIFAATASALELINPCPTENDAYEDCRADVDDGTIWSKNGYESCILEAYNKWERSCTNANGGVNWICNDVNLDRYHAVYYDYDCLVEGDCMCLIYA